MTKESAQAVIRLDAEVDALMDESRMQVEWTMYSMSALTLIKPPTLENTLTTENGSSQHQLREKNQKVIQWDTMRQHERPRQRR